MLDKASWKDLLTKARKGDAIAQYDVGDYFSFGFKTTAKQIIVKQNFSLAFNWYEKAASNGAVEALTNVADFLSEGKGCEKDISKAMRTYLLAINKGSGRAAFNLGTIYRDKGNFKKAFEYYSLANKIYKTDYSFTIALCYYYGIGVSTDKTTACKYLHKVSADKSQMHSQYDIDEANYLLGLAYLTGDGVKKSLEKSRAFFNSANANGDHPSAEKILFIVGQK